MINKDLELRLVDLPSLPTALPTSLPVEQEAKQEASNDFISLYLAYTAQTECPTFFHRWTAVTALSAYLGKRTFFHFGHFTLYPNLYVMLIGSPGTKKSSAIKIGAKLLKQAGYKTFAAKKTRQEKFLLDLAEQSEHLTGSTAGTDVDSILDQNLWGEEPDSTPDLSNRPPAECFVAADEFNNFIGIGNTDFISILGELWDHEGVYDYKLKNSKSVFIPDPSITILGGNTPTGFAQAFPTETIGQGFFSRLLLVYGEPSGVKHTFPPPPDTEIQTALIAYLHRIKEEVNGEMTITEGARKLLDTVYHAWLDIEDIRFEHYSNRRLTHLIKLCLVLTAARVSTEIGEQDVIYANTLLTFTEQLMPKALGEFGKAKHSAVTHKVMIAIDNATIALSIQGLWKVVHQDLDSRTQLGEILGNLQAADKIQAVQGGFLPKKKVREDGIIGAVDWNLLHDTERNLL